MARVLEREAVEDLSVAAHQRKRVEDANRPRMPVEQLPEVRLAQPAVDPGAHLDAHDLRDDGRAAEPPGEVDLAESALAEQPFDLVHRSRVSGLPMTSPDASSFRAAIERKTDRRDAARRRRGCIFHTMERYRLARAYDSQARRST